MAFNGMPYRFKRIDRAHGSTAIVFSWSLKDVVKVVDRQHWAGTSMVEMSFRVLCSASVI